VESLRDIEMRTYISFFADIRVMANDTDIAIFPNGAKTTACDPEGLCFGSDAKLADGVV
jgi:hypothetical protein